MGEDCLGFSVSQVQTADVGPARLYKQGSIVLCRLYAASITLSGSWATSRLGAIPEGFRPDYQLRQKVQIDNVDTDYSTALWVNGNDELYVANFGGTGFNGTSTMSCTACWAAFS